MAIDREGPSEEERADATARHWQTKVETALRSLRLDLDATTVCARESQKAILVGDVGTEAAAIRRDLGLTQNMVDGALCDLRGDVACIRKRLVTLESQPAAPKPVQQCDSVSACGGRCGLVTGHAVLHYHALDGVGFRALERRSGVYPMRPLLLAALLLMG